jgi:phosphate transport system protein
MAPLHTDREYEAELNRLRDQLLRMGGEVEGMIAASIRAFHHRDAELARRMIYTDRQVNRFELDIDELCLCILARRQPVAIDLRFIATALKMVTDLERIGDLSKNICERVVELASEPPPGVHIGLVEMAEVVHSMVKGALDAFTQADIDTARGVIERDNTVDNWYAKALQQLLTSMARDPEAIQTTMRVLSVAKYLERIGDHATNLAEMVVFMVKGKDIRHSDGKSMERVGTEL